jgi:hypothetical protein
MQLTDEQYDAHVAFETFKTIFADAWGPYGTNSVFSANVQKMLDWMTANLSRGEASASEVGSWEIAFRNTKNQLTKDPTWLSNAEKVRVYQDICKRISMAQVKALLSPKTASFEMLPADVWTDLQKIGGQEIFRIYSERGLQNSYADRNL